MVKSIGSMDVWPEPAIPPVWPDDAVWPDWPPAAYWPGGPFGPVPWREGWACPGPTWDFCQWRQWETMFMSTVIPLWSGPAPYPPWWWRRWRGRPVPLAEGAPGGTLEGAAGMPPPPGTVAHTTGEGQGETAGQFGGEFHPGAEGPVPQIAEIAQPVYANPEDLARVGLTHRALLGTNEDVQETALQYASRLADSYLGVRYRTPFRRWGDDLRLNVAKLAAWTVMTARGYDPSTPHDQVLRMQWDDAIRWLEQAAARRVSLAVPLGGWGEGPGGPWGPWGGGPRTWAAGGPRCTVW